MTCYWICSIISSSRVSSITTSSGQNKAFVVRVRKVVRVVVIIMLVVSLVLYYINLLNKFNEPLRNPSLLRPVPSGQAKLLACPGCG
jgi:hypothetical protein